MKRILLVVFGLLAVQLQAATYYYSFVSGDDTRTSTQAKNKATPWKHHKYMQGATSNAAAYTHVAGDQHIFKGGETWDHTCFSFSFGAGGSAGNSDYYGVDATWYTGGSWTRPIFDGEHTTLASGANTNIINLQFSNITIDNIEIKRLYIAGTVFAVASIGGYQASASNILIENCYIHDWQVSGSVTTDDARGGIIFSLPACTNVVIDNCEITNIEQSARMNGIAVRQANTVRNCYIHDVSTALAYVGNIYNNTFAYINTPYACFDATFHTNVMYIAIWDGASTTITTTANVYNNIIHDIATGTQIYCEPCFQVNDGTVNVYNNVYWNNSTAGGGGQVMADPEQGTGAKGTVNVYNNTFVNTNASDVSVLATANHSGTNNIKAMAIYNNHFITNYTALNVSTVTTVTQGTNITQSASNATTQGFVIANNFAPTGTGVVTYNVGTDKSSIFTTDILGVSRPQAAVWDIGAYEYAGSTAPVLSSATVDSGGTNLADLFSLSTSTGAGGSGGMKLTINSVDYPGTYASGSGSTTYNFTVGKVYQGATATVTYTQPGNGLEATSDGTDVASFGPTSVTNNSTQTLSAPSSLTAGTPTSSTIPLTWTDNMSGAAYAVEDSIDNSNWSVVTTTATDATSYTLTTLSPGVTYYARVRGTLQGVYSTYSNTASAATTGSGAPQQSGTLGGVSLKGKAALK